MRQIVKIILFKNRLAFMLKFYSLYLKFFSWYIRNITNCINRNIQWDIFFQLPSEYRKKTMSENSEFSNMVKNDILFLTRKEVKPTDFYNIKYSALQNQSIKSQIINYFLVYDYLYSKVFRLSDENNEYYLKAQAYDENIERINNFSQIKKIAKDAFKRKKLLKKNQNLYAKNLYTQHRNKEFGKIKITFNFFTKAITLFSIILLVSGFLYNYFLFKNFGVLISNFFTATDYIESSIDVTVPILLSTTYSGIITLMGYLNSVDKKMEKLEFKLEHNSNKLPILVIFITIFILIIFAIEYFVRNKIAYFALEPLALLIGYILWAKFYNDERFEEPQKIYILGMLFIFLSVSLFFKTINDINKIKMGEFNKNYKFSLAKESKIEESNYIKSISNYSFFYNTQLSHIENHKFTIYKSFIKPHK